MSAALARSWLVVAKESSGGGVLLCRYTVALYPGLNHGRASLSTVWQDSTPGQDVMENYIEPWPMTAPIYGEGWRSYSRLVIPTYDMAADWALETGKKAIVDAATYSRNAYDFFWKHDANTTYLLLVAKGKQSSEYLQSEILKKRDRILDEAVALTAKSKEAVKSGKAKEMVAERIEAFKSRSKELMDLLQKKIKDNDDLIKKINLYSKKSKDATLDLLKNAKLPKDFSDKSEKLVKKSKDKSVAVYEKSKELSWHIINRSRIVGDLMVGRIAESYSQAPSMIIMMKNSKYLEIVQDFLRRLEASNPKQDYTYVNKFFNRFDRNRLSNVVPSNKPEFTANQTKQEFHSSALQVREVQLMKSPNPQICVIQFPRGLSNVQITGEISTLIPGPVKKIWRGIRDKSLPSWQATIASLLQRIQDSLMKKKK